MNSYTTMLILGQPRPFLSLDENIFNKMDGVPSISFPAKQQVSSDQVQGAILEGKV